jgi:hypothetical protein
MNGKNADLAPYPPLRCASGSDFHRDDEKVSVILIWTAGDKYGHLTPLSGKEQA